MALNTSDIRAAEYSKNARKCGEYEPCFICGRPIKQVARYINVHGGGASIVTDAERDALNAAGGESADMGVALIGPDCARQHRIALAEYIMK